MEAGGERASGKKLPHWDKFDTQRFVAFIGDGTINPTQLTKEYIERIRRQYWPQRDYRNFSANYRRTSQIWLVHRDQRECCCLVFFAPLSPNKPVVLLSSNKPTLGTTAVAGKVKTKV